MDKWTPAQRALADEKVAALNDELARWAGATVISTVSGAEKARLAAAAGAHHVINYREGDPAAAIREIAPGGVDIVAEVALGANLALDVAVLRTRGTIATYANEGGKPSN